MAVGRPGRRFVMTGLDPGAESVELPAEIAHRVRHVMRLREGESVELLDGAGGAVEGEHALSDDGVLVKPRRSFRIEAPRGELRLGVPLLKSGNTELAVQKATELGATDFLDLRGGTVGASPGRTRRGTVAGATVAGGGGGG